MRVSPTRPPRSGPLLLPARVLLLLASLLAIGLGSFNLGHELHAGQVDVVYTVVGAAVAVLWLVGVILVWRGVSLGAVLAGAIAFAEFGVIASTHFVSGPAALSTFAKHEGLALAAVLMGLLPACALAFVASIVSWSHPTGRRRSLGTLPILVVALLGAVFAILAATDSVQRADFGTANPEDGAFAAAITATAWLLGALWIARVRRTGAIVIAVATFIVWYSFVTIHVVTGGTPISDITAKSGPQWAGVALASATLAGASFLMALGVIATSLIRRRRSKPAAAAPPARRASR